VIAFILAGVTCLTLFLLGVRLGWTLRKLHEDEKGIRA
jgi:hypothetical protein